jgi:hypothetical protein
VHIFRGKNNGNVLNEQGGENDGKIINEQDEINEQGGRFSSKLINEQDGIRASRVEKNGKIAKRACSAIRQVRVLLFSDGRGDTH